MVLHSNGRGITGKKRKKRSTLHCTGHCISSSRKKRSSRKNQRKMQILLRISQLWNGQFFSISVFSLNYARFFLQTKAEDIIQKVFVLYYYTMKMLLYSFWLFQKQCDGYRNHISYIPSKAMVLNNTLVNISVYTFWVSARMLFFRPSIKIYHRNTESGYFWQHQIHHVWLLRCAYKRKKNQRELYLLLIFFLQKKFSHKIKLELETGVCVCVHSEQLNGFRLPTKMFTNTNRLVLKHVNDLQIGR